MLPRLTLVLGGAASGKSKIAETLAKRSGHPRTYIATAEAFDDEMEAKIAAHRAARAGDGWRTVEAPRVLADALDANGGGVVLVDCLTLWLSNVLLAGEDPDTACAGLMEAVARHGGPLVVVSNEVGQGIVPDNALSRRFRASQGLLNQEVAGLADCVVGVMAGLPLALKGPLPVRAP